MTNTIWWILGLATIGGAAFYYSKTDSAKKLLAKDLCIEDLPDQKKKEVLDAIKDKDVGKLNSFAKQAELNGWKCAADQIKSNVSNILSKCPNDSQMKIAVDDISSGKLSLDGAQKLANTLDKNGCTEQRKKILDALELKKSAKLELSKDSVISLMIGDIKASVESVPEPDKSEIITILKQSKDSKIDYTKFSYDAGRVLAYADVAAKYKALKAETQLRDLAAKIQTAISKSETEKIKSENELRAETEWPAIMSLPDIPIASNAKAAALCLHKTSAVAMYDKTPAVKLTSAIPGCSVDVDRLNNTANEVESKYGSTFSEAVFEMRLIINSLKKDFYT